MTKKYFYFFRGHKYDLLTAVIAIALALATYVYSNDQVFSFYLSSIIILISLIIIIYLRSREKDFYYVQFTNRKDRDDWIGKGSFEYSRSEKCFLITNAEPGYIFSKALTWSDYKYQFDFKIIRKCIGAVIRAINLSNCVMLQIAVDGINPHIKINGSWNCWNHKKTNLSFNKVLSLDSWYKCLITCEKEIIHLKLYEFKNKIFDREWEIPHGSVVFQFKREEDDSKPTDIPFPINLEYGTIGFRNHGSEYALIKNVLIEKI